MRTKRKQYDPEFKVRVALAAVRGEETVAGLAARYQILPTMIHGWKRELTEGAGEICEKGGNRPAVVGQNPSFLTVRRGRQKRTALVDLHSSGEFRRFALC